MASKMEAEHSAIEDKLNNETESSRDFQLRGEFELPSISNSHPERQIKIGKHLRRIQDVLFEYQDIFSWTPNNLGTISRDITKHQLGIPTEIPHVI